MEEERGRNDRLRDFAGARGTLRDRLDGSDGAPEPEAAERRGHGRGDGAKAWYKMKLLTVNKLISC